MNRTQMIKQAYVRGLAARGILRMRAIQKQAAGGLKDYAISGGIGAAGGSAIGAIIGALVRYAKKKKILGGALAGAGIGGGLGLLGGLGYQYSKKGKPKFPIGPESTPMGTTPEGEPYYYIQDGQGNQVTPIDPITGKVPESALAKNDFLWKLENDWFKDYANRPDNILVDGSAVGGTPDIPVTDTDPFL